MEVREFLGPHEGQVLVAIRAIRDRQLSCQACAYRFVFATGTFVVIGLEDAQLDIADDMIVSDELFEEDVLTLGELRGRCFGDWWIGRNAQGYRDLVQLSFTDTVTRLRRCVQLIGMPSMIDAYAFDH